MLRPIFRIDINTQRQKIKHYVKVILRNCFFKMFQLFLIFFIDISTTSTLYTQISRDVMCAQYVIQQSKKKRDSYQKEYERCYTFKSNLNIKNLGQNLMCVLIKKTDFKLYSLFFYIRTSKFCLRLAVLNFFSFLRLKCS